jgi:hypothetical protein
MLTVIFKILAFISVLLEIISSTPFIRQHQILAFKKQQKHEYLRTDKPINAVSSAIYLKYLVDSHDALLQIISDSTYKY